MGGFLVVDGIDGSGKSVCIEALKESAEKNGLKTINLKDYWNKKIFPRYDEIKGYDVILSSEPTYSWVGEAIREEIIRNKIDGELPYSVKETAQAYALDRSILYKRLLIPALKQKKWIFQERSVTTSIVFQPLQASLNQEKFGLSDVLSIPGNTCALYYRPDMVVIASCAPEVGIKRLNHRHKKDDAIFEELEFQKQAKKRFESHWLKKLMERYGSKVDYIDTGKSKEKTKESMLNIFQKHFSFGSE